ncbi:OmpP1/FadL family transporter [Hydrogenophilus thermoluteolus]|uniref:Long-chain fatty acid transport protein n=1 Tax=Hydrogenophilus thermoluteolus TaxID=297 RepID=A0A2Z6DXQ3_HYDTE|nr:outer membrane protein transport protein [Hydrogenophilus thermoluteolus]BBD77261.1 long-chain fatty acid transport protein [Hydrogenophilus thermoluteolus]
MKRNTFRLTTLASALFVAGLSSAHAGGFQLLEQNASGIANAYAGSAAVADNASTIFFNPAGMTQLSGAKEVSLGLAVVKPSFKFANQGSLAAVPPLTPVAVPLTGSNGADAGDWAAIPNGYYAQRINDRLSVGVGFGAPFGLKTEYTDDWVGRFQSTLFDIKTMNVNPSVAYRVNDKVSVGAGVSIQKMEATYDRYAATLTTPINLSGTKLRLKADDVSFGWNVGVLFQPTAATRVGLSYRSKVKHTLTGTLTASGGAAAVLSNPAIGAAGVNAKVDVDLPDTFIVSFTHQLNPRWEVLADLSWTGWSSLDVLPIYRTSGVQAGTTADLLEAHFRDTWRVALGANYHYNNAWTFKFGIAHDESPVKNADTRLVSLPDNNRIWLSLGAQWRPDRATRVDFGLAHLFINDTRISHNQTSSDPTKNKGWVIGEYTGNIWLAGVQYSRSF